jgi:uncharacterized protein YggU (UPF0235/DUF167 family)
MYIKVRVQTGAKKEVCTQLGNHAFVIAVKEKAKQNLANRRVLAIIAAHYQTNPQAVRIVSGHHSPSKMLKLHR